MRLLRFSAGDAPNIRIPEAANNIEYDAQSFQLSLRSNENVRWVGVEEYAAPARSDISRSADASAAQGSNIAAHTYLLELDDGRLLPLDSIVTMRVVTSHIGGLHSEAITEDFVQGVDFRTQKGKKLDVERQEYGRSFKVAAAKPISMHADAVREKRQETEKRDRERKTAEIEGVEEEGPPEKKRSSGRRSKKENTAQATTPK